MARNKANQANIDGSDLVNYPNKRIRDNDGSNSGTPVNEPVYGDIHEFFAKLMRLTGINYNDLPDNEANGYQYIEALKRLTTKNDVVYQITSDVNGLVVNFDLALLQDQEYLVCKSAINSSTQVQIKGGTTTRPLVLYYEFIVNDFLILKRNSTDIELLNLNPFKAATNIEEEAGTETKKFTTPASNKFIFDKKVIGALSINFLAIATGVFGARNGLLSSDDKKKIDESTPPINKGFVSGVNVDSGSGSYVLGGDITAASIITSTAGRQVIRCTMLNAALNTDYVVESSIQSLGAFASDVEIQPIVWKPISTTQFEIALRETASVTQNLKIHLKIFA